MKHLTKMGGSGHTRPVRRITALVLLLGFTLLPSSASARVSLSGDWSKEEKPVSLSLSEKPRGEAIRALAEAAGWSIVVDGVSGHTAELHIKDQAPSKVLELLLSEGDYDAKRDGDLVAISRVAPPLSPPNDPLPGLIPVPIAPPLAIALPPTPPTPTVPPVAPLLGLPHASPDPNAGGSGGSASDVAPEGEDRVIFGNSARVQRDETVHDLVVLGGSATVLGSVTGDLVIMGGSAEVKKGARVFGDAIVFGGSLDIEKGARIDGETNSFGGSIHGGQSSKRKHRRAHPQAEDGADPTGKASADAAAASSDSSDDVGDWTFGGLVRDVGRALAKTAVLWLVGALLLAFGGRRMETLEVEVARRPLRLLGVGFLGSLVTLIAFVILLLTIIGIPFAVIGMFGAVLAAYAGVCAVLTAVGNALGRHRTGNVYAHLAIGCVAYLILTAIPFVGDLVTFAVTIIGFGAFVATRGAGLFGPRAPSGGHEEAMHASA